MYIAKRKENTCPHKKLVYKCMQALATTAQKKKQLKKPTNW
jgi:hypothetical protein